jgi:hypothetical protein
MRAFLIDPVDRTIRPVNHSGKLDEMYKSIGCSVVEAVHILDKLDAWIDEEGALVGGNRVFEIHQTEWRLAGRALILGVNEDGECTPADITLRDLSGLVRWTELVTTGDFTAPKSEGNVFHTGLPIYEIAPPDLYVIWSNEHSRWWGHSMRGYVSSLAEAGRYERAIAMEIARKARVGWDGKAPPNEIPVREVDALAAGLEGPFA